MIFASAHYFVFLALTLVLLRAGTRNFYLPLLIATSLVFYGWWNPVGILLPLCLCLVSFWGVKWIRDQQNPAMGRVGFVLLMLLIFTPLAGSKYSAFFYNEIIVPLTRMEPVEAVASIPLGISFITFTVVAYIVDLFRRSFKPSVSFSALLAHILFFPHLIAGPILRPGELIPQLLRQKSARISSLGFGLLLFTVGLVKKTVFADSLGEVVDPVFDNPSGHPTSVYWVAILGYTLQIYFDFSGYTDMALGSARMMGIRLPENFRKPYSSCSIREFWRRWHMTLSRWLRDYLYIPLGGNRCSRLRHLVNILATMTLCGLWHGANWTFIAWGTLHGLALAGTHASGYSEKTRGLISGIPVRIKWLITFSFISLSWVLFRAKDIPTATTIFSGAFAGGVENSAISNSLSAFPLILIVLGFLAHRFDTLVNVRLIYRKSNKTVLGIMIAIIWAFCLAMGTQSSKEFIYFDF